MDAGVLLVNQDDATVAKLISLDSKARLHVYLESLICQKATNINSYLAMTDAEVSVLCEAAALLFAKETEGDTENTRALKRLKKDIATGVRNPLQRCSK